MSEADDIDLLAAEYALGTLSADERAAVALRAQTDASLAAAIDAWELRLAPLAETIPERAPPASVWTKIQARIGTQLVADIDPLAVIRMARSRARWQATALAATAVAASLLLFVGVREVFPPAADKTLVAVLQKDAQSPAFLVSVDLDKRQLTIRAIAAKPEPGKSYELWLVHDDLKTPRSLGVIGDNPVTVGPSLTSYSPNVIEHSTLAVTLEPPGGSPSGAPTGPVLWSGKLLEATQ